MKVFRVFSCLALIATLFLLAGCGSPKKTVEKWKAALDESDLKEADKYVIKNKEMLNFNIDFVRDIREAARKDSKNGDKAESLKCKFSILSEKVEDDTASVKIRDYDDSMFVVKLIKDKGDWKIIGVNPAKKDNEE